MSSYVPNIPQPTDNLSDSQGDILTNFQSLDTIFAKNHFAFSNSTSNNGKHNFVQFPKRTVIPPGLISGDGTVYSKTSGETELFYTPDNTGNEYQMSITDTAKFSLFATNTPYVSPVDFGGWTFLPGGIILNYGTSRTVSGTQTITFAKSTATLLSVTVSYKSSSTKYGISTESGTGFTLVTDASSSGTRFYWMAIGV